LNVPGAQYVIRGIDEVNALRPALESAKSVAIVGGGYIGLEAAAVSRKAGLDVHVIEQAPRLLARVATPETSVFFARLHEEEGVHLHLNAGLAARNGKRVTLLDGTSFTADIMIVGIGIDPNVSLAKSADLICDNGVLVDEFMTTNDEDILAIGDCANAMNMFLGRWARLESVQNAVDQAQVAAQVLAGEKHAYRAVPWFWSDQYDVKFQSVGLPQGYDELAVRGDMSAGRSFSIFYLKADKVIAADCFSRLKDFMAAKRFVAEGMHLPAATAADEEVELKSLFS
jgi:3-phenylpropionate/trans-cinnamate dioxygenase ferredoxin reductase subunit